MGQQKMLDELMCLCEDSDGFRYDRLRKLTADNADEIEFSFDCGDDYSETARSLYLRRWIDWHADRLYESAFAGQLFYPADNDADDESSNHNADDLSAETPELDKFIESLCRKSRGDE